MGALDDGSGERVQERGQRSLLSICELEQPQFRIEAGIAIPASVVILDDVFECAKTAVVRVRRRAANLTQGWCLNAPRSASSDVTAARPSS